MVEVPIHGGTITLKWDINFRFFQTNKNNIKYIIFYDEPTMCVIESQPEHVPFSWLICYVNFIVLPAMIVIINETKYLKING